MLQTGVKGVFNPGPQKGRGFWPFLASTNVSFCSSDVYNNTNNIYLKLSPIIFTRILHYEFSCHIKKWRATMEGRRGRGHGGMGHSRSGSGFTRLDASLGFPCATAHHRGGRRHLHRRGCHHLLPSTDEYLCEASRSAVWVTIPARQSLLRRGHHASETGCVCDSASPPGSPVPAGRSAPAPDCIRVRRAHTGRGGVAAAVVTLP